MDETKLIGTVFAVTSAGLSAVLNDNVVIKATSIDRSSRVGQIGSYVVMPESERSIIGTVVAARDTTPLGNTKDGVGKRLLDIQTLGTLQNGKFERGLTALPVIGSPIYSTTDEDLRVIFATYRDSNFSLGTLSLFDQERLYIDPNRFFSKHIALFGSTGSGKSSTVASILQKVQNFENTHVIMLDLHGEYATAFQDTGNLINITELELPYWLMNFEELVETFIDEHEHSANNQMMVMKEAVLDSKRGKNLPLKEFLTIDTPVYFDFLDVMVRMKALDTERTLGGKEGPFYGQFTRFLVRMDSKLTDKRYEFLFKPKTYRSSDKLGDFLSKLFGVGTGKQITIIDLSRAPFDVINVLVSLLGRVIYDFNLWNTARRDFPILVVFEEAHAYLSNTSASKAARETVERIAKEGRKYGVSCMIVSQRPAEISETIVAQCNNFVAMRLLNPNDQNYVRKLVPDSQSNFIDVLPTLRQGEAFIIGDCVALPVRVLIDKPYPAPGGADIQFFSKWQKNENDTHVTDVVDNWWKQRRTF
ncbi:MAG TPA: ATP-binding protein [Bacteroidota bacterium]|nr:ATP-binding protein [Bacteroidota bacterium]